VEKQACRLQRDQSLTLGVVELLVDLWMEEQLGRVCGREVSASDRRPVVRDGDACPVRRGINGGRKKGVGADKKPSDGGGGDKEAQQESIEELQSSDSYLTALFFTALLPAGP